MRFKLAEADRERLGITQEWIEFSLELAGMLELEEIEDAGYEADQFIADLRGRPILAKGKPVLEDGKPKTRVPMKAMRAALWVAARNAGSAVPYAEFNVRYQFETATESEGKGEAPSDS